MNRNVEIKARVENLAAIRRVVEQIADMAPVMLEQEDTFFRCSEGQLIDRAYVDLLFDS